MGPEVLPCVIAPGGSKNARQDIPISDDELERLDKAAPRRGPRPATATPLRGWLPSKG